MTMTGKILQIFIIDSVAILALACGGCASHSSDPSPPPLPSEQSAVLIVEPGEVFLGTIEPGRCITTPVTVRNRGDAPIVVARINASCPCVRITPASVNLDAGGSACLSVVYDSTEEPEFRGALAVLVTGLSEDRVLLFRVVVHVEVK